VLLASEGNYKSADPQLHLVVLLRGKEVLAHSHHLASPFFLLQGVLLASEGKLKRACKSGGLQLHPFVSHLAVLLALGVTADMFFWPPLLQPGIVQPLRDAVPPQLARWLGMVQ
jgi:hypothetical protein